MTVAGEQMERARVLPLCSGQLPFPGLQRSLEELSPDERDSHAYSLIKARADEAEQEDGYCPSRQTDEKTQRKAATSDRRC